MARITTKAALILGTNLFLHLVDFQGTDIAIDHSGTRITSTITDFTSSSSAAGIVKRPVAIGDTITVNKTTNAANEGIELAVTSVSANEIQYTVVNGAPVDEVAGSDINILAFDKTFEFVEAGGLSFVDGVDGLPFVARIVDLWQANDLDIYSKMWTAIEPRAKSMALLYGWGFHNENTRLALRGMAVEVRDTPTSVARLVYPCAQSGSFHAATDQMFFWDTDDPEMDAPVQAVTAGFIDQLLPAIIDRTIDNNDITGVTQANPAVVTATAHGRTTGETVQINNVLGMTELNGNTYRINVLDANSFELENTDSSGFGAYTSGGDFIIDRRGDWAFRCLTHGKTPIYQIIDFQFAEIKPVESGNDIDPKLADPGTGTPFVPDVTISAGGIYANILLNEDADGSYDGDVDGTLRTFDGFIDGDTRSFQTVHTKVHYLQRQPTNINNDGTGQQIRGDKTPPISSFSGDLFTIDQYYLLNFDPTDRNNLNLIDDGGITRAWPQVFTIRITAGGIAVGGEFSVMHANTFGASNPTYLQDEGSVSQQDITIAAINDISVSYSSYNVDGHTPGTPLDLVVSYNNPGFIEPDHEEFTLAGQNITVPLQLTPDPSYVAV